MHLYDKTQTKYTQLTNIWKTHTTHSAGLYIFLTRLALILCFLYAFEKNNVNFCKKNVWKKKIDKTLTKNVDERYPNLMPFFCCMFILFLVLWNSKWQKKTNKQRKHTKKRKGKQMSEDMTSLKELKLVTYNITSTNSNKWIYFACDDFNPGTWMILNLCLLICNRISSTP